MDWNKINILLDELEYEICCLMLNGNGYFNCKDLEFV